MVVVMLRKEFNNFRIVLFNPSLCWTLSRNLITIVWTFPYDDVCDCEHGQSSLDESECAGVSWHGTQYARTRWYGRGDGDGTHGSEEEEDGDSGDRDGKIEPWFFSQIHLNHFLDPVFFWGLIVCGWAGFVQLFSRVVSWLPHVSFLHRLYPAVWTDNFSVLHVTFNLQII